MTLLSKFPIGVKTTARLWQGYSTKAPSMGWFYYDRSRASQKDSSTGEAFAQDRLAISRWRGPLLLLRRQQARMHRLVREGPRGRRGRMLSLSRRTPPSISTSI